MLNVFLLFANTFLRLLFFLAGLIPQLLQKSPNVTGLAFASLRGAVDVAGVSQQLVFSVTR